MENTEGKKEVVAPDKEESISLKDNKEISKEANKKKKPKKISLQTLNLGTKPINISLSNNLFDFNYIINLIKSRIKTIIFIIVVLIVLICFLAFKSNSNDSNVIDNNEISIAEKQNLPKNKNLNGI